MLTQDAKELISYGCWDHLKAHDLDGNILVSIPAHDGDFFPETTDDHIAELRKAVQSKKGLTHDFWPVRVDIDITQQCPDNCYFCYSRPYSTDPLYRNATITIPQFSALLQELADGGTKTIRFTGGGEPLSHPEFTSVVQIPKKLGLSLCVITNGTLLTTNNRELLRENVDHIRLSLNAATDKTRQKIHRSSKLTSIKTMMEHVRYLTGTTPKNAPTVWVTFLLVPENIDEIIIATKMVRDIGVNSISFRPIYHNRIRQFTDTERQRLAEQLHRAKELHAPPDFSVFIPKRDVEFAWNTKPEMQFGHCISCKLRTVVESTNEGLLIKICGLHRGSNGTCLGVIKDKTSFKTIWQSSLCREKLENRPKLCPKCIDLSMNTTLTGIWNALLTDPTSIFHPYDKQA
jgi:MoaA/NifB/PqqE/SkfB family radical SAM enzyme